MAMDDSEYMREYMADHRQVRKRLGRCCECGAEMEPERFGQIRCSACQDKHREYMRKYRATHDVPSNLIVPKERISVNETTKAIDKVCYMALISIFTPKVAREYAQRGKSIYRWYIETKEFVYIGACENGEPWIRVWNKRQSRYWMNRKVLSRDMPQYINGDLEVFE